MKHLLPNSFICIFLRCLGNGKSPTNLSLDDSIIDIYVGSIVIVAGELLIVFSVAPSLIRLEGNARGDDLINPPPIELCLLCQFSCDCTVPSWQQIPLLAVLPFCQVRLSYC